MRKPFRLSAEMRSKNTLTAAKAYVRAGRKIILLHGINKNGKCTCGDSECSSPGKHPLGRYFPNGIKSATTNLALIHQVLNNHKNVNIAITLDGLTVVDIDGAKGRATIKKLNLPRTIKVKTGRGTHRYFQGEIPSGTQKLEQLDILTGPSRMAIVPPSSHPNGKQYAFLSKTGLNLAAVPENLGNLKSSLRPRGTDGVKKPTSPLVIKNGERNNFLFKTACHLRRQLRDEIAIESMLRVLNDDFAELPLNHSELSKLLNSSAHYVEDAFELFGPPKVTEPLPMEWLWYPYIPYFGVTIIAGDPGKGKSLLIALLIAAVTNGGNWPLSNEPAPKGKVLLLSAEDSWQRVTLNRLLKYGADISNLHMMHKFNALTPENLDKMAQYIAVEKPRLIVIDTLAAFLGSGRDMNRQNEVGEFLGRLTEIAEKNHCSVLAIGHLNKQSGEHPLYRIVGSIGFVASIRSALFYGSNPADRAQYALAHGKANASELGPSIVFEKSGGGRNDVPVLKPLNHSDASPFEVCKVETNAVGRPTSASENAREIIIELLSEKPVAWKKVESYIDNRNIASPGTLNLLRAEMAKNGEIVQVGRGPATKWKLADRISDE